MCQLHFKKTDGSSTSSASQQVGAKRRLINSGMKASASFNIVVRAGYEFCEMLKGLEDEEEENPGMWQI